MPWGISESGFNARDLAQIYQYSSFGVPGLGLKRGLSDDVVIAPVRDGARSNDRSRGRTCATSPAWPRPAASGRYGFREALDYTARRLPEGASVAVVSSYMAHHQGMTLVAFGNVLHNRVMVERFHADPLVEATELLLQERMPRNVLVARNALGGGERGRCSRSRAADAAPLHSRLTTRSRARTCCRTVDTP